MATLVVKGDHPSFGRFPPAELTANGCPLGKLTGPASAIVVEVPEGEYLIEARMLERPEYCDGILVRVAREARRGPWDRAKSWLQQRHLVAADEFCVFVCSGTEARWDDSFRKFNAAAGRASSRSPGYRFRRTHHAPQGYRYGPEHFEAPMSIPDLPRVPPP